MHYDLVVFDIGGVLVQADRTWVEAAERVGLAPESPWRELFEARLATLPRRGLGAIGSERYFALFAEASGGMYTVDDARRISDASLIAEYPGIAQVLDSLEGAGLLTAVLSNANDGDWARLFPEPPSYAEFPTLIRIPLRFSSHLIRVAKPDAAAFRAVELDTGCSGAGILFFDDRVENVEAARMFGWTAELLDARGDTADQLLALLRLHGVVGEAG